MASGWQAGLPVVHQKQLFVLGPPTVWLAWLVALHSSPGAKMGLERVCWARSAQHVPSALRCVYFCDLAGRHALPAETPQQNRCGRNRSVEFTRFGGLSLLPSC